MMYTRDFDDEMKNLTEVFNLTIKNAGEALGNTSKVTTLLDVWDLFDFLKAMEAEQLDYPISLDTELQFVFPTAITSSRKGCFSPVS